MIKEAVAQALVTIHADQTLLPDQRRMIEHKVLQCDGRIKHLVDDCNRQGKRGGVSRVAKGGLTKEDIGPATTCREFFRLSTSNGSNAT
jgi:hypothetical protein